MVPNKNPPHNNRTTLHTLCPHRFRITEKKMCIYTKPQSPKQKYSGDEWLPSCSRFFCLLFYRRRDNQWSKRCLSTTGIEAEAKRAIQINECPNFQRISSLLSLDAIQTWVGLDIGTQKSWPCCESRYLRGCGVLNKIIVNIYILHKKHKTQTK